MDTIEIPVGPLTFDGLAAGPDEGEPVLLLHGFPQTSRAWEAQVEALGAAGYRAVAFDQRGYSPRARPTEVEAYGSPELTADVIGAADALGLERFHLVGHDWGGAVAWQVAGRHADRLRTLTVVSTPHPAAMRLALDGQLGGDQAQRSAYMPIFREPDSQDKFLANDAQVFHMFFAASGMPEGRADPYLAALGTREALGAALNWYRAADLTLVEGLVRSPCPPCTCGRRRTRRWAGRRPRRPAGSWQARTGSRFSTASGIGYQNKCPTGSTRCCWTISGGPTENDARSGRCP